MAVNTTSMQEERAMSEVRRWCHAGLAAHELLQRVARAILRVVPYELYAATLIDPATNLITQGFAEQMGSREGQPRPVNPAWFDHFYFEENFGQTLALVRQGRWAASLADEMDGRLERSLCFRESMQPAGIAHKAHLVFVDRLLWGDMELYREAGSPAFSAREIAFLRRIAPDVGGGLKAAALQAEGLNGAAGASTPGVLVVDYRGHITATPAAERLLAELGDLHPRWREGRDLPAAIQVVLGALRQSLDPTSAGREVAPRLQVRARSGRWLSLHASGSEVAEGRPAERLVVISPDRPREIVWLGLTANGLSSREEEVVRLVVGGLSTRRIAEQLFIAEHTVQRHLSNIFEKVGVRSRRELVKQFFFDHMLMGANEGSTDGCR